MSIARLLTVPVMFGGLLSGCAPQAVEPDPAPSIAPSAGPVVPADPTPAPPAPGAMAGDAPTTVNPLPGTPASTPPPVITPEPK